MLVRLLVKNLFSFKEITEFNLLPGRFNRLSDHVLERGGIEALKLSAVYGPNGAGKSNIIKAITLLQGTIEKGKLHSKLLTETFKLNPNSMEEDVYIGIEFVKNSYPFYYGLTVNRGIIIEEELSISGLNNKEDEVLFLRTDRVYEPSLNLKFSNEVMSDKEASLFPQFLSNEILERNVPVLFHMASRKNKVFEKMKWAHEWITDDLEIILPESKPGLFAIMLERNKSFCRFANETMRTLNTGVGEIGVETIPIEEYFGEDDKAKAEKISAELRAKPKSLKVMGNYYEQVIFVMENEKPVVKKLYFLHEQSDEIRFSASNESDGTLRLVDYIPVFYDLYRSSKTYIVDEIERSLHAIMVKVLIEKFSKLKSNGQLIFSTHESNLLDQDIFRPDEIWFAEKNRQGATELYTLSDFKEHHTIDIRKGYLNGRYGAIPFLGNLKDLNWDKYAEANPVHL